MKVKLKESQFSKLVLESIRDIKKPWFVILLGGSGTGKGSLVKTTDTLGDIQKITGGATVSTETLKTEKAILNFFNDISGEASDDSSLMLKLRELYGKNKKLISAIVRTVEDFYKEEGNDKKNIFNLTVGDLKYMLEKHPTNFRLVLEPDRILRLAQYNLAIQDYNKIVSKESNLPLVDVLREIYSNTPKVELDRLKPIEIVLKQVKLKSGNESPTVDDFFMSFPEFDDFGGNSCKIKITKKLHISDAFKCDDSIGNSAIKSLYQQFRLRGEVKEVTKNTYDVGNELAQNLRSFRNAAIQNNTNASVIIDSAGEDLATQNVKWQIDVAKANGYKTMIVLIANSIVKSYVGNMERGIVSSSRIVDPSEINSFYNTLSDKHKVFKNLENLDEYLVVELKDIEATELADIVNSACFECSALASQKLNLQPSVVTRGMCEKADEYLPPQDRKIVNDVLSNGVSNIQKKLKQKVKTGFNNWGEIDSNLKNVEITVNGRTGTAKEIVREKIRLAVQHIDADVQKGEIGRKLNGKQLPGEYFNKYKVA